MSQEPTAEQANPLSLAKHTFSFGKFSGRSFIHVFNHFNDYFDWALEQANPTAELMKFLDYGCARRGIANPRSGVALQANPDPAVPDVGSSRFTFGKYSGMTFAEVYSKYPEYYLWARELAKPTGGLVAFIQYCNEREPVVTNGAPSRNTRAKRGAATAAASDATAAIDVAQVTAGGRKRAR
eukprot:TRINITY_DN13473_c0_g1_i1.p1 TRINITY_DN13473_c0_g1~~TRINITY_DN13473_c0_g1_i1.p1  ORF type:complete len:182 (-),score=22.72 TRINITY_DN13473_c0_g1_i1:113-658(-)